MTSIGARIGGGIIGAAFIAPFSGASGALTGYIYAKLADLPAGEVAKAWAIWTVAQSALTIFVSTIFEDRLAHTFAITVISVASTAIGINKLQKRNLIGQKMVIFLIAMQVLGILGLIFNPTREKTV